MPLFSDSSVIRGARFSDDRRYRYRLWRGWGVEGGGFVAFVGLNPSKADERSNDPTIRRCINFAKMWDFGGIQMLNAFAYISTDPYGMLNADDPVGPANDATLRACLKTVRKVIVCWGNHCPANRQTEVLQIIKEAKHVPYCLGCNKNGTPKHPARLASTTVPILFKG